MQGKLKGKAIKVKRLSCAALDFESPAPQALDVVAKERKSVRREPAPSIGAELPPGCPVRVGDWGPFAGSEELEIEGSPTDLGPGRPFSLP